MAETVTKETIRVLAQANGLNIPEERLDRVLKQYQSYLKQLARIDAYPLPMEAEPSTLFTLLPETPASDLAAGQGGRRGK